MTNRNNALFPEGKYANYFEVGHNAFEFVLDFGQSYVDGKNVHFHSRIVTSPIYAKALLETLRRSVEQYELTFEDDLMRLGDEDSHL